MKKRGMKMESYSIFRDLAIIIVFAKVFGIIARKCKAPQVVGEIIAGLLIGPSVLGLVQQSGKCSNFYSSVLPVRNWCRICIVQGIPVSG